MAKIAIYIYIKKTLFLYLVPFLEDLDTFHGPYLLRFFWRWLPFFWTCTTSCWTRPFPKPSPLWIDSPSCALIAILQFKQCNMAGSISVHCVASVPPSHSALFSISNYFSHLFRPFSVMQGLNLVSTWVKVPHLGGIHLVSISKIPPLCASQQFPAFIHLVSTRLPLRPLNSFLHASSCGFNVASQQLPAFMRFQYLSFPPLVSPQLLACAVIWVQYLGFHCAHLVSMSNFPPPPASLSPIFCTHLASISTCSPFLWTSSYMDLVSISKFSPPCARSKKTCTGQEKKVPRSKNIQPNVSASAYNNGVSSPSPLWTQGPQSRCRGPKSRNRGQKQLIWRS